MFKKMFVLSVALMLPGLCQASGIDIMKSLIPNRVAIDYLVTSDSYSIPALSIEACHVQKIDVGEKATPINYNFTLPKVILDAEGELGIGSSMGLGIYNVELQMGFYSIIGDNQHESDKDYRAFVGLEIF